MLSSADPYHLQLLYLDFVALAIIIQQVGQVGPGVSFNSGSTLSFGFGIFSYGGERTSAALACTARF